VGDKVRYQKVERRILRRGDGTPEARLLRVFSTPLRKVMCIVEQVVCIRHLLLPCLFPYRRLFGLASVIVVWPHAKGIEIQMVGETQLHIVRYLTQAILGGVIRQNDLEEYGPLVLPVLTHAIPDTHNVGLERSLNLGHYIPDLVSLANSGGHEHMNSPPLRIARVLQRDYPYSIV
jgi:hypothetical protein